MPIIKSRPKLALYADRRIVIGQSTRLRLVADARADVKLEALHFTVERVVTLATQSRTRTRHLVRVLGRDFELAEGLTEFLVDWTPSPGCPPSHDGHVLNIDYRVRAVAVVPWWPDRTSEFSLVVSLPASTEPGEPFVARAESPRGASLEVALDSDLLAPGAVVRGVLAVAGASVRRLRVVLVGREQTWKKAAPSRVFYSGAAQLDTSSLENDERLPFRVRVPDAPLSPSFESVYGRVLWHLEVRADVPWSKDLQLSAPLRMVSQLPPDISSRRAPALLVGSERIRRMWTDVGNVLGLTFDGEVLVGVVDGVQVQIHEQNMFSDVPRLGARLRWAEPLGLGLALHKKSSGLRRNLRSGRFDEQVEHVYASLSSSLALFYAYEVSDEGAVLFADGRGVRRGPLLAFGRLVLDLAQRGAAVHSTVVFPPPLKASAMVWTELARELEDGVLYRGQPKITGRHGVARVAVHRVWEGEEPAGTRIEFRPPWLIDDVANLEEIAITLGLEAELGTADEALTAYLPGVPERASELLSVVRKLSKIADRLRSGGPFR